MKTQLSMRLAAAVLVSFLTPALATAQGTRPFESDAAPKTVIGPSNPDLSEGAKALLAGNAELGVRKTLAGLEVAVGPRQHEAALSNLCAGYILLAQYQAALGYCDLLLARNDDNWRAYSNRALAQLKLGNLKAAAADVERALRAAHAWDFVSRLPAGPETVVGERGSALSGGQRQRIAIARVLLKDAPILILDEATSALDSEVEAAIQEQLYNLMAGKTVIAIAHRLSTIAAMDRLVIMDQGAIVEQGTHDEGVLPDHVPAGRGAGLVLDHELDVAPASVG